MKTILSLVAIILAATAATAGPVSLFDGKTFVGWEGNTKTTWRIENGMIVAGSHDKATPRNEFLSTKKCFENFDLRLKFKITGDKHINAGVQFRTERIPEHHEVIGFQADIGPGYYGALYDESRRRKILAKPNKDTSAKALAAVGKDGWHTYRIRAKGSHIQLWLNGVMTVDYIEKDPDIAQTGIIAIQIHGKMQAVIAYKDILIEELPSENGKIKTSAAPLLDGRPAKEMPGTDPIKHVREFLDCVKSREKTARNADAMRRGHIACHAAAIAWKLGRKTRIDPATETFIKDDEANRMRQWARRSPWHA